VNESICGSVPVVWHVSLEMDVDHVWDAFFIYSLLLDHAECDAVLKLDHNAPSQAKHILSLNYLLTNFEYFIYPDSVFDLFASRMFEIVSKTCNS
jgi:hypothetical protein